MIRIIPIILALLSKTAFCLESTKPPHSLNTLQIAARIAKQMSGNSHIRIRGACVWLTDSFPPKIRVRPAIKQFIPDLIVTVSNNPGENPWLEARQLIENKTALSGYASIYKEKIGYPLGFGNDSMIASPSHLNEGRSRVVGVFAAPTRYFRLPTLTHRPETRFPMVYYSSLADSVMERSEAAELAYMATHPGLLINHEIGSLTNHWGMEIPRLMHVTQPYRFRASVVAAMHAADIISNKKNLHINVSTTNRCGRDCIVANVIYDPSQSEIIWQEVYPNNRMFLPGDSADFGTDDDRAGNGNYIFAIWRKYEGCVEQPGELLVGVNMGEPHRR